MVGFWTSHFRFPRRVGPHVRQTWFALSLNLLKRFFICCVGGKTVGSWSYFHSGPRLRMCSNLFRGEMRRPLKVQWLWRYGTVDVTLLYFAHKPFVHLSQQTLIVEPNCRNMRCGSSDVHTKFANVKKCVRFRLELVNWALRPLDCVKSYIFHTVVFE